MPIDSDLQAAGRRAAAQHVPAAPSIETLEAGAAKHTSRRRLVLSGAAAVVLVALAFPLALTMRGSTSVQTVAAGTGQAAAAQTDLEPVPAALQDDLGDDGANADTEDGIRIQLRSGDDFSLSIRVLSGQQAISAAEAASVAATETLEIDGMAVWVSGTGDERIVSALVEPEEFIEVTGSATELDMLIEVLRDGGLSDRGGRHGLDSLDDAEWQQFFDHFEDGDFNLDVDIDGVDFDLDELLKEFEAEFDLNEFFGPDSNFNFDGDGFSFDGDFSEFFGPDGEFDFAKLFGPDGFSFDGDFSKFFGPDGEFTFPSDGFGHDFGGCIVIDQSADDRGESFHMEFPEGCSTGG